MTQTLIENGIALDAIAKTMKTTVARVETEARSLDVYVGVDWAGRPAVSVVEAAGLVSGDARRVHDHDAAWRAHLAATEDWEAAREAARRTAFQGAYDASERQGRGSAVASDAGHEEAREAVRDFERRTPPPRFAGQETSPRWLTQATQKIKEVVS